jgi:hypothetical protein
LVLVKILRQKDYISIVGTLHGIFLLLLMGDVRGGFPTPEKDFFSNPYLIVYSY